MSRTTDLTENPSNTPAVQINPVSRERYVKLITRLRDHKEFNSNFDERAPYGYLSGRRIMAESSQVLGGIHPGVTPREAIVIDESHGALYPIYMELLISHVKKHGKSRPTENTIFPLMQKIINKHIKLLPEHVPTLHAQRHVDPDQKVALDLYIRVGYGAERHQVLLAAYLIEKLIDRELLDGTIHLEITLDDDGEERERLVYSALDGRLITYDPRLEKERLEMRRQMLAA